MTIRSGHGVKTRASSSKRISYREAETDDESDENSSAPETRATRKRVQVSRDARTRLQSPAQDTPAAPLSLAQRTARTKRPSARPSQTRRITRSSATAAQGKIIARSRKSSTSSAPRTRTLRLHGQHRRKGNGSLRHGIAEHVNIPSDGVIPAWSTLPYAILLSICQYVSLPMGQDGLLTPSSVRSLLAISRTCKSFAEPAVTALYECPPLHRVDSPHQLFDLLQLPSTSTAFNYASKIRHVRIDANTVLGYSTPGRGRFNIPSLLPLLPRLTSLDIGDREVEMPPFRCSFRLNSRWLYPMTLFNVLEECGTKLTSWKWQRVLTSGLTRPIGALHAIAPFNGLQSLHLNYFCICREDSPNFDKLDKRMNLSDIQLAELFSHLTTLKEVTFQSCDSIDCNFLSPLPRSVTSLNVVNGWDLQSIHLQSFLRTNGAGLKNLRLDHNPYIDMAFLPELKATCPELESLHMDLTYYSTLINAHHHDEPKFHELLDSSSVSVATWPTKLHTLELLHLRKWSSHTAENFFASLIQSAGELPYLRKLVIKAILDISWRDRATFRDEWIARLQRVFLDDSPPPDPSLASFKAYRLHMEKATAASNKAYHEGRPRDENVDGIFTSETTTTSSNRRSGRIKTLAETVIAHQAERETKASPNSHASMSDSEVLLVHGAKNSLNDVKQGRCNIVDITIDNMRPAENRFTEQDFMDSEHSGDEEYRE